MPTSSTLDPRVFASHVDASAHGQYPAHVARTARPAMLHGRVAPGTQPGRYHLYAGWFCPRSHRALIVRELAGLTPELGVSYVHGMRDARGWAFREQTGADQLHGLPLLRDVYRLGAPEHAGAISVPVLWDRDTGRIVSNDPDTIDVDLATAMGHTPASGLVPAAHAAGLASAYRAVDGLGQAVTRAVYSDAARADLRVRLAGFDTLLGDRAYLVAGRLTLADVRLWVLLARYDAGPNATGAAGPRLTTFAHLWAYARRLYALPAFHATTDFSSFAAPLTPLLSWAG